MPTDTYGAIFAYNHADWYVGEVLANAGCYGSLGGGPGGGFALTPQMPVLACSRRRHGESEIPADYLTAFEDAAARYELGTARSLGPGRGRQARVELRSWHGREADARTRPARARTERVEQVRGRRRRRRPHPPCRPGRLGGDPGAADLVAGSLRAGIFAHNQADWYVQEVLSDAEAPRRPLQDQLRRLAGRPARLRLRNRRDRARFSTTASPAPPKMPRQRSRRRSPRPTRSPLPPTSGAAATAPGTPPATTARALSASRSTGPACSTPRLPQARWRATANPAPVAGSPSTPAQPTPTPRSPACAGTP